MIDRSLAPGQYPPLVDFRVVNHPHNPNHKVYAGQVQWLLQRWHGTNTIGTHAQVCRHSCLASLLAHGVHTPQNQVQRRRWFGVLDKSKAGWGVKPPLSDASEIKVTAMSLEISGSTSGAANEETGVGVSAPLPAPLSRLPPQSGGLLSGAVCPIPDWGCSTEVVAKICALALGWRMHHPLILKRDECEKGWHVFHIADKQSIRQVYQNIGRITARISTCTHHITDTCFTS